MITCGENENGSKLGISDPVEQGCMMLRRVPMQVIHMIGYIKTMSGDEPRAYQNRATDSEDNT